jgi:5-methylcytosine-specific restriction enzyme subunit McrC
MSSVPASCAPSAAAGCETGCIGRIPVRNLWLLMLYASQLYRELGSDRAAVEENPDDIPDLVAEILSRAVERRLRRNLSRGYQARHRVLSRVRGHVDMLQTETHQLLARGRVACRYEELSVDTPRNRLVVAALDRMTRLAGRPGLAQRCRNLAESMRQLGVKAERPSKTTAGIDCFGLNSRQDRAMVSAARLALELALPTESAGIDTLPMPSREQVWVRKLYEKAVAGFYDVVISAEGWSVRSGTPIAWQVDRKTPGIDSLLPSMRTDIVLDHKDLGQRIVIDTKFNSIVTRGWYRDETFRNTHLYQVYAYLRSQEGRDDPLADRASGLLLHPSVGRSLSETVEIQGHAIRFATVDLAASAGVIRRQLLKAIDTPFLGELIDANREPSSPRS